MFVHRLGRLLPTSLKPVARRAIVRVRHRGLRPDDSFLVSYPKSGSTWLRFLLATALADTDVDFDSVRRLVPPVGRHRGCPAIVGGHGRLIRSHEPLSLFGGRTGQKVVYLVRDGRDVAVSYFHHARADGRFHGGPEEFVDAFLAGRIDSYGTWHDHVMSSVAFSATGANPVLIVKYEDLRADTAGEVERVVGFFGVDLPRSRIEASVEANAKERMRAKEAQSQFMQRRLRDGSSFVRADEHLPRESTFSPEAHKRLEDSMAEALGALGYLGTTTPPTRR